MDRTGMSRWLAIAAVGALVVVVAVLAVVAYEHAHPPSPTGKAEPVPTFTLGVRVPTPTPTVDPDVVPPAQRRLLATGGELWWRTTVGACNGPAPIVERSTDRGATWTTVTPNYLGISQVQTLSAFSARDAELVAAMTACDAQALRTYTRGEFWESYPDVLAASRYVDPKDAGSVRLPSGPVAAPCKAAWGLHAEGPVVALVCDELAWSWSGSEWLQLAPEGVVALAIDGSDVLVAHEDAGCPGVAVSRIAVSAPDTATPIGCAESADPTAPIAIDDAGGSVTMWTGPTFLEITP
ncbi:hypothetical protein [Microbacterium kyungheense]|nr:hypothetical protein [Microbacterium kyungheense]